MMTASRSRKSGLILCLSLVRFVCFADPSAPAAKPRNCPLAIFKDDIPPGGAPASPDYLARLLEGQQFATAFLTSETYSCSRERFDVLILPYGASFPVRPTTSANSCVRAASSSPPAAMPSITCSNALPPAGNRLRFRRRRL